MSIPSFFTPPVSDGGDRPLLAGDVSNPQDGGVLLACTIRDIARAAGVSVTTVSLVLRGKECRISEETRAKVQQTAREMHYVPNQVAVSLVTKKTNTIGLVYSDMLNPFYAEMAAGLERSAHLHDYGLLICNCDEQVERCIDNISLLESRCIDGFVLQPPETINASPSRLHALQEKLKACTTPYVILDRAIHDVYHDYVAADHQLGGRLAAEHLVRLGHTRIGCITGSLSDYGSKRRLAGYREVLEAHGIPYDPSLVYEGLYQIESGYRGTCELLKKDITAIFAFSDLIAVGVQRAATEFGISIPHDLSLVGYDDSSIAPLCSVPLTTIRQPIELLGRQACEILLARIQNPAKEHVDYFYPPALIQRSSCSLPRANPAPLL